MDTANTTPAANARGFAAAGLAVTLVDALDGIIYYGLTAGLNPIGVLQYIASGIAGASAFSGGLATAALGLGAHVFLSFGFTAVLFGLLAGSKALRAAWPATGLAWGALVYLFMTFVALPHSNVAAAPLTALAFVHGIVGHALVVGLLPAFIIKKAGV
jgi:membrane-associated HD superfamily phosphohydrolase